MSSHTTSRTNIVYLEVGQRSKEAAINTAFDVIDTALRTDLGEYTVATLPSAAANANAYALATNASGGRTIVRSNGTLWKIVAVEGATVS